MYQQIGGVGTGVKLDPLMLDWDWKLFEETSFNSNFNLLDKITPTTFPWVLFKPP